MTFRLMLYLPVSSVTSLKVRTTGYLGGLVKTVLTTLIFLRSFLGQLASSFIF
jgi:hypothetical protein